ncbi:siderophore synthetase component [Couchioplanes caeruleus]|uniref:Siderophore synthetase component n=1 Tax=Couchioplanes caeruleus TaxID=56438 RepID=A0A3N1GB62_9ACTN|nr:IucA/IucC family siderophore biosynthesis protein [Couchioplanes caeruleus]ROP27499.1 siderophore synthetase component [Couchioplanes caeruleus]
MPTPDSDRTRLELGTLRPGLVAAYDRALPRARAEILGRLLGALHREPLPGVAARAPGTVTLADGRVLTHPAGAATPFATPAAGLTCRLADGGRAPGAKPAGQAAGDRTPDGRSPEQAAGDRAPGETPSEQTDRDRAPGDRPARPDDRSAPGEITDPAALIRALGWATGLHDEIANSVANLALAYADPPPATAAPLLATAPPLADVEQLVLDGHPLHPCCRTRAGMDVADVLAYGPEHRPTLRLRRLRVPADRWYGDGPPILLAHPWQAAHLRERHTWLRDDGETGPVRPLMSLRTVATGTEHVKTAVDVQMTSAVRTVSPAAVHNGPRLSALLRDVTAGLPLTVLAEYGAGAVLVDGRPDRHLAHLHRAAPRLDPGETAVPLAALAAADPYDGRPLLMHAAADPYAWWHDLTRLLFPPLLAVLDRGVALEAHGQNTLVVLHHGRPARIVYRDLGGVRVSPARLRAAGFDPPPLEGDLPCDDPAVLRTKLAAALGTVAGQLVAVLEGGGADPVKLWASAAAALASAGTVDAAAMLRAPLPVKATTAMRLAADPLDDLWTYLDNPMAAS